MTRIYGFILVALVFACQPKFEVLVEETDHLKSDELKPFYHGVASGDPLSDRVVIWTRVTPEKKLPEVEVKWEVSSDPQFAGEILSGTYTTDSARDYTLKVDVTGLSPGQIYYYRFQALGATSMAGRTKTATQEASDLQFAVVSCSNYEWGYFNAYGRIAERSDIDAVIHLGDYIYEYGPGRYGDTSSLRKNLPPKEIVSLYDYRTRYALYRLDSDLRSVHSKHPFIAVWDDHEIANDSYKDGAQNHQEDEGPYEDRRNAAVQAYYEWLPIREGDLLYRRFQFGPLADLFMLDERLEGRTAQLDSLTDPSFEDPNRSMLGTEQLSWWLDGMKQSTAHWKIIGNQVIFSYLDWGRPTFNINLDSWDGYIAEQQKVLDFIGSEELENIVFVTGDTHSSWALEVTNQPFDAYDPRTAEGAYAVEFGTTSINSANSNERFTDDEVLEHEQKIVNSPVNPHLKYANLRDHGYLLLTLTKEEAIADWYYVETVKERSEKEYLGKRAKVKSGEVKLELE